MICAWELPSTLNVGGIFYNIRSDYRAVLDILVCFSDLEYTNEERLLILLQILYVDFDNIPVDQYEAAVSAAFEFIDMGMEKSDRPRPTVMDWRQDAPLIISAINQSRREDIRAAEHLHWWTFLSAYMEIGESLYATVLNIRQKQARHKPLEKHEKEFIAENRQLIELRTYETDEVRKEKNNILRALDGD